MSAIDIALNAISKTETDEFLELVVAARLNPKLDFIGADLSGMKLSNLDLTDFEFYAADFREADIEGTILRSDFCIGALFSDSRPSFVDETGLAVQQGELFERIALGQRPGDDMINLAVIKYYTKKLAFDRMGFVIRFVQDSSNTNSVRRFAEIALHRESSSWCKRLLTVLARDGWTMATVEARALEAALKSVHSFRRHELIFAIEDNAVRTKTLIAVLTALRRKSRSERIVDAIDRIVNNFISENG
jgi:Pentapeptide repeats (8 copies)